MNLKPIVSTFLLTALCLSTMQSHAFEKDFPPYPKNQFPPTCKIHTLKVTSETDRNKGNFKSVYHLPDKAGKLVLRLDMNYQKKTSGLHIRLDSASGKAYVKPTKVGGHPSNIGNVMWAYLNKDSRKDFIITLKGGDGYLSGGRQRAIFLLSHKGGYSVQPLGVYTLGQEDFYDYSTDDKCEYLHQSLVSDGKQVYWAYHILQFIDDDIVIKNQLSRYFPKWIKLTAKPNSKASSLTKKQIKMFSDQHRAQIENN